MHRGVWLRLPQTKRYHVLTASQNIYCTRRRCYWSFGAMVLTLRLSNPKATVQTPERGKNECTRSRASLDHTNPFWFWVTVPPMKLLNKAARS